MNVPFRHRWSIYSYYSWMQFMYRFSVFFWSATKLSRLRLADYKKFYWKQFSKLKKNSFIVRTCYNLRSTIVLGIFPTKKYSDHALFETSQNFQFHAWVKHHHIHQGKLSLKAARGKVCARLNGSFHFPHLMWYLQKKYVMIKYLLWIIWV